jgi:hypothetical protein
MSKLVNLAYLLPVSAYSVKRADLGNESGKGG